MKISILTMHRVFNYGSVWQTYALSKFLTRMGHVVEIIDYIQPRFTLKRRFFDGNKGSLKNKLYFLVSLIRNSFIFSNFLKCNLSLTKKKYYSSSDLTNNLPIADVYLTGSDQVWNSFYNEFIDPVFFLDFAPADTKRIAFSSSFGKSSLDAEELLLIKPWIEKYDALSVREVSAIDILEQCGRKDGVNLLDPTFLLDKSEWYDLAKASISKERYLLIYSIEGRDELIEYAREIAEAMHLRVYTIAWGFKQIKGCDKTFNFITPQQFLSLFVHSEFVVTNSFHGTAYSINLNKQFISVPHPSFNSRIESILGTTGLSGRMVQNGFNLASAIQPINYEPVIATIILERQKSLEFLEHALTSVSPSYE